MSNNLTSNHQILIHSHFFFQTPTRGIFKGDFLHFLFCRNFENLHIKSTQDRSKTYFSNINKNYCILKKGRCQRRKRTA